MELEMFFLNRNEKIDLITGVHTGSEVKLSPTFDGLLT